MGKQNSLIQVEGTLGGLTFYKSGGQSLVRTKGGVSADRIASDPAFARTRENNSEFSNAATAGKTFRNAFRPVISLISDRSLVSRLTQSFRSVLNFDTTSARGERKVALGIVTPEGEAFLSNFNINSQAGLGQVLYKAFTLNATTKVLTIPQLLGVNDLVAPQGATHVTFKTSLANIDFDNGTYTYAESNAVVRALNAAASDVVLTPASIPAGTGVAVVCLSISFTQEVNGTQYSLKNGAYNVLAVVDVA
jgi:hypothetical protein